MIKEINQHDYKSTMMSGMSDVTETAEPVVDVWPYVKVLADEGIVSKYVPENFLVEKVYRSNDNNYDHVLLPTSRENYVVVLVINIKTQAIIGHLLLEKTSLYTLNQKLVSSAFCNRKKGKPKL